MHCISVLNPWAGLLALGIKEFETRSWKTQHRGRIAIHASARIPKEGYDLIEWLHETFPMKGFNRGYLHDVLTTKGCVLGEVDIVNMISTDTEIIHYADPAARRTEMKLGDWSPGRWLWQCENPVLYTHPIPAKGSLSIWNWDKPSV